MVSLSVNAQIRNAVPLPWVEIGKVGQTSLSVIKDSPSDGINNYLLMYINPLYAVDINADKENDFLNWDSPISMESEKVKAAFDEVNYMDLHAPNGMAFRDYVSAIGEEPKSSEIYKSLSKESSPQKASELFLKHGIKGIRYLDQRSREKGDGTYNFVIFDPSVIQIVSKSGEFVMSSKTPENVEV